jgi:hypothetical protein
LFDGLRREGRHPSQHPDRLHLERFRDRRLHDEERAEAAFATAQPRRRAELDVVEGIPDEYLQMNGSHEMTPEQRFECEAEGRSLYDGMVRIVITPAWVKLIDFETTLPTAVE